DSIICAVMNAVLEVSAPVFGLGFLGYFAVRFNFFSAAHADGLARFVYHFAVPLLLFRTLAGAAAGDIPWRLVLAYYAPVAAFYAAGMFISGAVFKRGFGAQVITGFACSYGNAILLGLPLALLTFGAEGQLAFFILLAFHALSAFTVTTLALEYGRAAGDRGHGGHGGHALGRKLAGMAKGVATNPVLLGVIAGILFNRLDWRIPGPLDTLAAFMQNAVTPCALFALGATLTRYGIAGRITQTAFIIAAKCMAFPLAVWCSCMWFGIAPLWSAVAALMAAQPVGVNVFIFAERYNTARALATTAVFLSTVFSLASLPLVLYLIDLYALR
ncbi:MAG: AEC family transporter, partial [Gammaproteobacteria bacterium]|nr:AEC family transporter [Gammaproteobacteria bacterium]